MNTLVRYAFFPILAMSLILPISAKAALMIRAVSVSSPQDELSGFPLVDIINQSGLSATYASGLTDFNTFTSTTTTPGLRSAGFTGIRSTGPQQFTFDLGTVVTIDAIAIWNTNSVGAINNFSLFSDSDSNFGNGTSQLLLGPTELLVFNDPVPAQVFGFSTTSTRFIHINGLNSLDPPDFYGLSEVAFSQVPSAVPEPRSLILLIIGLAGVILRKCKK